MKRFIVISLLALSVVNVFGCAIPGTHNYYLFSVCGPEDWQSSVDRRCTENWKAYAGSKAPSWFDAETYTAIARGKGDALMVSYLTHLSAYLECAHDARNTWDYPTKEQLAERRQQLIDIRQYALDQLQSRLRSQHALLYMRCNMMLEQHHDNLVFWEQTAKNYIKSVYRDMMRNIYAGALLKSGRNEEATQIYAEQGDQQSLYTYYYRKRTVQGIREEYERNPNSAALPFLLQDFANNAQEAYDEQQDGNWPGKMFVHTVTAMENRQMCMLADRVLSDHKTLNPALWMSLKAWLYYLSNNRLMALQAIERAVDLKSTLPRVADNARVLRLYIRSMQSPANPALDQFLANELEWLSTKAREERSADSYFYDNHYTRAYDRLVHQALVPRYTAAGRSNEAIAFLGVYDEQPKVYYQAQRKLQSRNDEYRWNNDYSGDFFYHLDTIPTAQVEQYLAYMQQPVTTETSALRRWLSSHIRHDATFLHELLGTKYLRLAQWQQAVAHLEEVPLSYINTMNIVPFMARRSYSVEPWLQRQRIKEEDQMPSAGLRVNENQKLQFAREMMQLEQGYDDLAPATRGQRAYQLAIRYTQASYAGDAWYLTRYGKSIMDTLRADEVNMLARASELLATAVDQGDSKWKEKMLFARAFLPIDSWYSEEWNNQRVDNDTILQRSSHQYKALQQLIDFTHKNNASTSEYVSRCDVLRQFIRHTQH